MRTTTRSRLLAPALGLAAAMALLLTACGSDNASPPAVSSGSLEGPTWLLDMKALGVDGADDITSTITFADGRAAGSNGCNQFTGPYTQDGSKLTIGLLAGTQRACTPPGSEVETTVMAKLGEVKGFAISGETLTLNDGSDKALLTYTASTPSIEGAWTAVSVIYNDAIRSVIIGTDLTAEFTTDGNVSGSAGCNNLSGGYTVDGQTVKIGPLATTRKLCDSPEGVMEQEAGYVKALESATRFDQVGPQLQLFNAEGQNVVTFDKASG